MNRSTLILAAYLIDRLAGDPEWLPHPVRLIGLAISRGESALRHPAQSNRTALLAGAALASTIVAGTYFLTRTIVRAAHTQSPTLGKSVELLLAWTCLAARNLEQEASSVVHALEADNVPLARQRLARIVGRDTQHLDTPDICRAVIETLAESASDGIVAPLFFLALGGVPLALAYKAVNTLDSMIGHADQRYFFFGKFAARLDDAANFIPARLTAAALIAASSLDTSTDPQTALRIWLRDGHRHKSPNAGQPEAAIAGALHVQLGGANTYAGELIPAPRIASEFLPPILAQAHSAIRLITLTTLLAVAATTLLAAFTSERPK
jgi:adenosylcobinamide-phosphate synthase